MRRSTSEGQEPLRVRLKGEEPEEVCTSWKKKVEVSQVWIVCEEANVSFLLKEMIASIMF